VKRNVKRFVAWLYRRLADVLQWQVRRAIDRIDEIQYDNILRDRTTVDLLGRAAKIDASLKESRPTTRRNVFGNLAD